MIKQALEKCSGLEGGGEGITPIDWSSYDQLFRAIKWGGEVEVIYLSLLLQKRIFLHEVGRLTSQK